MKKVYKMENLDCANCAAKMENAIGNLDGVNKCSISFMTQKLSMDVDDAKLNDVLEKAQKEVSRVDRNCKILVK